MGVTCQPSAYPPNLEGQGVFFWTLRLGETTSKYDTADQLVNVARSRNADRLGQAVTLYLVIHLQHPRRFCLSFLNE